MNRRRIRRVFVLVGVVASLAMGAVTVRGAAAWTAGSAPLAVPPTSADAVAARLADEEARSSDLQRQLDALRGDSAQLVAALDAAQAQIASDGDAAAGLRARLAAAQKRLATLEASIARARANALAAARQGSSGGSSGGSAAGHGATDDGEDETDG